MLLLRLGTLSLAIGLLTVSFAFGQGGPVSASAEVNTPYTPTLTFDVVSVRESKPDRMRGFSVGGGFAGTSSSVTLNNFSILNLLAIAYNLRSYQYQGLPVWTQRPMYNVQAKADEETDRKLAQLTPSQARLEQQHMMQALLAERFNLKTHWETRQGPVLDLVVAKGGSRMQPGGSHPPSAEELQGDGGKSIPELHQRGDGRRGYEFLGHSCHMPALVNILAMLMSTDVIDQTGLTGTYDFDLQYSQAPDAQREQDDTIWPPVTDAVEQQLGLKFVPAKGPIRTLVIDHIDPPSGN